MNLVHVNTSTFISPSLFEDKNAFYGNNWYKATTVSNSNYFLQGTTVANTTKVYFGLRNRVNNVPTIVSGGNPWNCVFVNSNYDGCAVDSAGVLDVTATVSIPRGATSLAVVFPRTMAAVPNNINISNPNATWQPSFSYGNVTITGMTIYFSVAAPSALHVLYEAEVSQNS
jgi:hypothetical protein